MNKTITTQHTYETQTWLLLAVIHLLLV